MTMTTFLMRCSNCGITHDAMADCYTAPMARVTAEMLLQFHKLQCKGRKGWYDIRRNGATKRWKRQPMRAEIPVKLGFYECFRLEWNAAGDYLGPPLRERPVDFNSRIRA